jgi:hypothetical protein
MNLEEVAQRFRERAWPRRKTPHSTSYLELAASAQKDPEPDVPGSFDEVDAAYEQGKLSDDEYDTLAAAMSESLRTQDRQNG